MQVAYLLLDIDCYHFLSIMNNPLSVIKRLLVQYLSIQYRQFDINTPNFENLFYITSYSYI